MRIEMESVSCRTRRVRGRVHSMLGALGRDSIGEVM